MADGKWLNGLTPDMPVADAARHVLTVRLELVRHYLPPALDHADQDVEHVHQLRVSTRRAGAALRIFADCLPGKVNKRAKKRLRQIRGAAGEARDWDVFLVGMNHRLHEDRPREQAGLAGLIGYAVSQRVAVQHGLRQAAPGHLADFERLVAQTVAAVEDHPKARTLLDLAQPMLIELLHDLDKAAGGDPENYDQLHQVRIAGKRLRYAMEVFADCFAPPFREEMYPAIEEMQEILGRANDSHVAAKRLSAFRRELRARAPWAWKRLGPGLRGLLRYHRRHLPEARAQFLRWWQGWQQTHGEATLLGLLRNPVVVEGQ